MSPSNPTPERKRQRFLAASPGETAALVAAAIPLSVLEAVRKLYAAGHRTVFVGGGVRDALLGRGRAGAWDVATAATPDEVQSCFPNAIPTGLAHGTVTVPLESTVIEITTFRTEGTYSDARRPDEVVFVRDLESDLGRRDFTINALAYDPQTGQLIDETGGLEDLDKGLLRAVGDARIRFREDALRTLRAARFVSTHGFHLEPETESALADSVSLLPRISAERVRDELDRLLLGDEPDRGLEILDGAGLLNVVLPELVACQGVAQNRYHRHDVYRHSLETVRAAVPRRVVRWAALCHDLGKPASRGSREDGETTFYGHAQLGAEICHELLTRLRFSRMLRDKIVHLVGEHLFDYQPEWTDAAVRRFLRRVGEENLEDLFDLRRADIEGTGLAGDSSRLTSLRERIDAELEARRPLQITDLEVDGKDVLRVTALDPGPRVGRILDQLLEEVLEEPSRNNRPLLLDRISALAAGPESPAEDA